MAPLRRVRSLSGMTRSASICCSTPSPPHFGQAPNGLLNENSRGSISEMVKPETGQANFSEKTRRSVVSLRCRLALARSPPPCGEGLGVGVERRRAGGDACDFPSRPPIPPSPDKRAFTPVFDGLWGEG